MTEISVGQEAAKRAPKPSQASPPPSTREIVADGPFCELLAEDLGVKPSTAKTCFDGEPKVRCIRVVEWALRHEPGDPERRAKMIVAWAKKRGAGAFRPDDAERVWARRNGGPADAEREIARAIGRWWAEHPDDLARVLREAMGNGRS